MFLLRAVWRSIFIPSIWQYKGSSTPCVLRLEYLGVGDCWSFLNAIHCGASTYFKMRNTSIPATSRGVRNTLRPHLTTRDKRGTRGRVEWVVVVVVVGRVTSGVTVSCGKRVGTAVWEGEAGGLEALAPACNVVCQAGVAVAYMDQRRPV